MIAIIDANGLCNDTKRAGFRVVYKDLSKLYTSLESLITQTWYN